MPTVHPDSSRSLPAELSSFIGRRRELDELTALSGACRLVTLTGTGGVGKTRLALRAATRWRRGFGGAAWFVDLTRLPGGPALLAHDVSPDALAYLVLAELGQDETGGDPPVPRLTRRLADRPALLVLDNCEHLILACAALVDTLLRACPAVRVLATSRESLGIAGETLYPLPPLTVPGPSAAPDPDELTRCDAVALLLARARAVAPDFALTRDNAEAVAELCRRLDGLPLAIELAAARLRTLHPAQILDRLADRFAVLSRGSRVAPDRQQTLRGCVAWSFDLCAKPERILWARLSVFAGAFQLDAVEGVCADECLPVGDLIDVLAGLVDKSIADRVDGHGAARYRMLPSIRDYGAEHLLAAGEQPRLRRRHRDWYRRLTEQAAAERISRRQVYWTSRLSDEQSDVRAAVEFCLTEPGGADAALQLITDLPWLYWSSAGRSADGLGWLDTALARATAPSVPRARALLLADFLAGWLGDAGPRRRRLDEGERLARHLRDGPGMALAGFVRGNAASHRNDLDTVVAADEEALRILATLSEPEQRRHLALRLQLLLQLGPSATLAGDHERARQCFQEALELSESHGATVNQTWARWGLALVAWRRGDAAEADRLARDCLRFGQATGVPDPYIAALGLELLAWTAARAGGHRRAATLLGAADAVLAALGKSLVTLHLADHEACERQVRVALREAVFADARRRGRALPLEDAFAYAAGESPPADPGAAPPPTHSGAAPPPTHSGAAPPPTHTGAAPLTRREGQVADLVAEGLSNKEIAGRLVISQRTAESHVEHILTKLGFTNRAQVAAWVAARRPAEER